MAAEASLNLKPGKLTHENAIEIKGMNKWFGAFHVLRDIDLTIKRGERVVVCGPSGSGKSTLIRCINRLEEHQKGSIIVDGTELTADVKKIDEIRRDVGMVFQHFSLFEQMTVAENIAVSLPSDTPLTDLNQRIADIGQQEQGHGQHQESR